MKAAQKEMQTAQLDLGSFLLSSTRLSFQDSNLTRIGFVVYLPADQVDRDIESAAAEVEEAESSLRRSRAEFEGLEREQAELTVRSFSPFLPFLPRLTFLSSFI